MTARIFFRRFRAERIKRLEVLSSALEEPPETSPHGSIQNQVSQAIERYNGWLLALLAILYFAALVSRNPAILTLPQFWAEDGQVFYQQARALGFEHSVWLQFGGYLHVLLRIVAGISLLFPIAQAPLVFAVAALIIQSLPAIYLSSPRMRNVGPLWMRILLSVLYLGVPNVGEVHGVLVHADKHFSVLCLLVLIAAPSASVAATIIDYVVLCLGAFTGPYSIFLVPVALLVYWTRRERRALWQLAILGAGATIQATLVLLFRPEGLVTHGASLAAFCRIFAFQIIVPVFRGINPTSHAHYAAHPALLAGKSYATAFAALGALTYGLIRGNLAVRCAILFGAEVFVSSLLSSTGTWGQPWMFFQRPGTGQRYWYIPELVVTAVTVWLVTRNRNTILRIAGGGVLCLLLSVDFKHWAVSRIPYAHWDRYAAEFQALPVGARMKIPINPMPSWSVELTKRPRDR